MTLKWAYWQEFGVDEEQIGVGSLHTDAGGQLDVLIGGLSHKPEHKVLAAVKNEQLFKQQQKNGQKVLLGIFTVMKVPLQILVLTFTK